jgi:outer membrane immunogenic protein
MTKYLLRTTALIAVMFAGAAQAADMPLKAAPYAAPVVNDWTGFYLGVHGGYGWGKMGFDSLEATILPNNLGSIDQVVSQSKLRGAVFGGHAGYNWQRGTWVGGIEIDYSGADLKKSESRTKSFPGDSDEIVTHTLATKIDQLASARARLGLLITPDLLLYGTGGAAWAHTKVTSTDDDRCSPDTCDVDTIIDRSSTNHFGWVAGAGGEWRLFGGSNWSLRAEYLHYDFGSTTHTFTHINLFNGNGTVNLGGGVNGTLTADVVRGGLSYKF